MPNGTGNFRNFQISRKKENRTEIFEMNFRKISVPFDFEPEFSEILVEWKAPSEFLDCKLAAPLSFLQGLWPRFCVHWAQNEARSCFALCFGVFRSVRLIGVFLELVFTPIAISPSVDWTELF